MDMRKSLALCVAAGMMATVPILAVPVTAWAAYDGQRVMGLTHYALGYEFPSNRSPKQYDWVDQANETSGTWIRLEGCYFNDWWVGNPEPRLELVRARTLQPDDRRGRATCKSCAGAASANWGTQPAGNYHFDVVDCDVVLDVETLHVTRTLVTY